MNNQQGIRSSKDPIVRGKAVKKHCGHGKIPQNNSQGSENHLKNQSIWGNHFKAH